ncbi:MAG TPA: cytochrome c [Fimbriiglobus sp.]|jgi:mono/diheme cytochrome c family protein
MTTLNQGKRKKEKGKRTHRLALFLFTFAFFLPALGSGCQQKMAEQPAVRTYGEHPAFKYNQVARPLEVGVIYRGQRPADDPLVTGLTAKGRTPRKAYTSELLSKAPADDAKILADMQTVTGAPDALDNFVDKYPFELTLDDLKTGQTKFDAFCALCHGAAGNGLGKIAERGFLFPPSYHIDPEGKKADVYGSKKPEVGLPQGYSRGFGRYGIKVPLAEVPVGYIFEVITRGYGAMPAHASQLKPADRWRIVAYVRALQLSQGAAYDKLPKKTQDEMIEGLKKQAEKIEDHAAGEK